MNSDGKLALTLALSILSATTFTGCARGEFRGAADRPVAVVHQPAVESRDHPADTFTTRQAKGGPIAGSGLLAQPHTEVPMLEMRTRHLFDWAVTLERSMLVGDGPNGRRLIATPASGSFEGDRLRGTMLPVGGDFALITPDELFHVDLRVCLETAAASCVGLRSKAVHGCCNLRLCQPVIPAMYTTPPPRCARTACATS